MLSPKQIVVFEGRKEALKFCTFAVAVAIVSFVVQTKVLSLL